jgi:hypothetical protein
MTFSHLAGLVRHWRPCLGAGQAGLLYDGSDAAAYGLERNYPYGPHAGELVQMFMVATFSHFDRIFPHHVVARGSVAPLPRAPEQLALAYRYDGMTLSLAEHLQHNATTSLLIARGGTILYEHYQSTDGKLLHE